VIEVYSNVVEEEMLKNDLVSKVGRRVEQVLEDEGRV
jgi:hypothetical protein